MILIGKNFLNVSPLWQKNLMIAFYWILLSYDNITLIFVPLFPELKIYNCRFEKAVLFSWGCKQTNSFLIQWHPGCWGRFLWRYKQYLEQWGSTQLVQEWWIWRGLCLKALYKMFCFKSNSIVLNFFWNVLLKSLTSVLDKTILKIN